MPKERYERWNPSGTSRDLVHHANRIIADFERQGYSLTLRQLYYQFVSKALIPNSDRSYKNLGGVIDRARKAGLIDWLAIEDRTRHVNTHGHVDGPEDVIRTTEYAFYQDLWLDQPVRIEVWVEKEALADVIARPANRWNCAWFCCRGYVSQSEQWRAARRIHEHIQNGQRVIILHLGDHDPSGIDMTRDIRERITHFIAVDENGYAPEPDDYASIGDFWDEQFSEMLDRYNLYGPDGEYIGEPFEVRRIALNWDQIQQYNPPPNPAKLTDSRSTDYIDKFGSQSWELDALTPTVINDLIEAEIMAEIDADKFNAARQHVADVRASLHRLGETPWSEIDAWLSTR